MAKWATGGFAIAILFAPMLVLVGVAALVTPATQASCLPGAGLNTLTVPERLIVELQDGNKVPLGRTQLEHAATIIEVGRGTRGVESRGIRVALMAALTESRLMMLANPSAYPESISHPHEGEGSDHDSLGLFQMRPSTGWGTVAQLMDPTFQAKAFYGGATGPNNGSPRGLLDIPGWQSMAPGTAAQTVEVSAYPDRYANYQPAADMILRNLTRARATARRADERLGEMPELTATPVGPAQGRITTVNANLKFPATTARALRIIDATGAPDFITLNEVGRVPAGALERALSRYDAYRGPPPRPAAGSTWEGDQKRQAENNAIMWRSARWRMLEGGRVKIVEDDRTFFHGRRVRWDRYATWGLFERRSGNQGNRSDRGAERETVAVIATHHMTNVRKQPRQWGAPALTRAEQYGRGMDLLIQLASLLGEHAPVLLGGDMNSHVGDGPFAAAPRMRSAGYAHTKDRGVMYQFFPASVSVVAHRQFPVPSDHPANLTVLSMDGARSASSARSPAGGAVGGAATEGTISDCGSCPVGGLVGLPGSAVSAAESSVSYDLGPVSPTLRRLVEILAPMFGIRSVGGYRASARDPAGHPSGNAADFMVPASSDGWATPRGRRIGDALAAYAQAHASELRVDYIIWWQHIWSVARAGEGWRPMPTRGSANEDHRNHVHINTLPAGADDAPVDGRCPTG